ncbi:ATP synthase F0 subunit C [[Mycoplasma] testudinis]|uniref:ATP synthase F0 subunit C n=1 Tax=[Mycoplasma] testudinis TaxID=33924 RepID=UPI00048129EE|nr:ATP synthase F0 subunit C [[Mycoplasma] testudinis]
MDNIILHLSDIVNQTFGGTSADGTAKAGAYIGGGAAMAAAAGVGAGQGFAAGQACVALARNPEVESKIRTLFIVGSAIAESSAIYGLIIAIILIFVA